MSFGGGVVLPKNLVITNSLESVENSDSILFAVPSQYIRNTCGLLKNNKISVENKLLISAAKGVENETLLRISEVIDDVFSGTYKNIAVISGPSHAEEVFRKIPTAVVSASASCNAAEMCRKLFMNDYFRVYNHSDITGVEIGGALKNVFAIAAGIADGLRFGDNTKALIVARGLKELVRVGIALGAKEQTFYGLSGVGDLTVTCFSRHSRNRSLGQFIGEGKTLQEAQSNIGMVAEGVKTAISAFEIGKKLNIETPIINEVYKVLFEKKEPLKALKDLMTRDPKTEQN
jgi:glycerol-3-phosphate dehydrogenase (NAD(P)+)